MRIRGAQPGDMPALREIYLSVRQRNFTWLDTGSYRLDDFDRDTAGEEVLVALEGEVPIGFIAVWLPDSFVHHLYVRGSHAGRGVGRVLLDAILARIPLPATLKCMTMNARATKFYADNGWRIKEAGSGPDGPYYLYEYGGS
jgi:GNAT superfamily N-acetyltransferase